MKRWTRGSITIGADLTEHITATVTLATDLSPGTGTERADTKGERQLFIRSGEG